MNDRFTFRVWYPRGTRLNCLPFMSKPFTIEVGAALMTMQGLNNEAVIMQSTGQKDKNDKLIFEGDILSIYDEHEDRKIFIEEHEKILVIEWNTYRFDDPNDLLTGFNVPENRAVLGNIYENPEIINKHLEDPEVLT